MNNNVNLSPQEKREKEYKEYEKFIALAIIPLAIYLFWPFLFGNANAEQALVVEQRIENTNKQEESVVTETNTELQEKKITPPIAPRPKKLNQTQNRPTKRQSIQSKNKTPFTLTHNKGDKIEYITGPQKSGWRGIVQSSRNGSYTVKITEVLLANDKQQYLSTNNPCNGGKPIGKKTVNQIIIVPGRCIHQK